MFMSPVILVSSRGPPCSARDFVSDLTIEIKRLIPYLWPWFCKFLLLFCTKTFLNLDDFQIEFIVETFWNPFFFYSQTNQFQIIHMIIKNLHNKTEGTFVLIGNFLKFVTIWWPKSLEIQFIEKSCEKLFFYCTNQTNLLPINCQSFK